MTKKELLYLKDAIEHEKNIISVCEETLNFLEEEELINFIEKEVKKHKKTENELMCVMEDKSNEWSTINE